MTSLADSLVEGGFPDPVSQGTLVVAGWASDSLTVDGTEVAGAEDAVSTVRIAEGVHRVEAIGGGRAFEMEVAVAEAHGTWVRIPEPVPFRVTFAAGQSSVPEEELFDLERFVSKLGDWSLTVQGGFSTDGKRDANVKLANDRAAALVDVLVEAGVPEDRIRVLPPVEPDPGESASRQRQAQVTPVEMW